MNRIKDVLEEKGMDGANRQLNRKIANVIVDVLLSDF